MDEGDPYDIGLNYINSGDPRRKIVKRHLNAILNDAKSTYRIDTPRLRTLGLTSKELGRRIREKHRQVEHKFHSGVGLELQYVDSKIAEQVMLRFVEMKEVCLPVHDSFIVRRGMESKLQEVMQAEFRRETGTTIEIKPTVGGDGDGFGTLSDLVQPAPEGSRVDAAAAMFGRHMQDYSISLDYLESWREKRMTEKERRIEDLAIERAFQAQKERGRPVNPFGVEEVIGFVKSQLGVNHGGTVPDGLSPAGIALVERLLRRAKGTPGE